MAIKAIIFDCFGVLVEGSLDNFCREYLDEDGVHVILEIDKKCDRGEAIWDDLVKAAALQAGMDYEEANRLLNINPRNEDLLSYIADELKLNYRISLLSNVSENFLDQLFEAHHVGLFEDTVLSYELGIAKPDVNIYLKAAERLGLSPAECLFIDDNISFCEGAMSAGMQSLQYVEFDKFKQELEELVATL